MKALAGAVVLLVVLGFCLPTSGEILVYKVTENSTFYWEEQNGPWSVDKGLWRGYLVMDVDYDTDPENPTIVQAQIIDYWTTGGYREFTQYPMDLELVRADGDRKVQWILLAKGAEAGQVTDFSSVVGLARNRKVGAEQNREVANSLKGYALEDWTDTEGRMIGMTTISATLYPAWTYWANSPDPDEGQEIFDNTLKMITDYLAWRGYDEV